MPSTRTIRPHTSMVGIYLCLWLSLAFAPSFAQTLPFKTYTSNDGLATSEIWDIYQDKDGILWIGTTGGVSRFNGTEFHSISIKDGLQNQLIRGILPDRNGFLWFGTGDGVISFDGKKITNYNSNQGFEKGTVWACAKDSKGRLFFGTREGGLSIYDGERFHNIGQEHGLPGNYIYTVFIDAKDNVWLSVRDKGAGRLRLSANLDILSLDWFTTEQGLPHPNVRAIVEDHQGRIYFATRGGGLARWNGAQMETFTVDDGLPNNDVYDLIIRRNGDLVIGSNGGGISICNPDHMDQMRIYTKQNGLTDDGILCLFEDREENLWVGTAVGLNKLATEKFQNFSEKQGLISNLIYSVHGVSEKEIWIGTAYGLSLYQPGKQSGPKFQGFTTQDGLPGNEIWAILQDSQQTIWFGTEGGLAARDGDGRFQTYTTADGLAGNYIFCMMEDREGIMWIGTSSGLSRWDPLARKVLPHDRPDNLSGNQIISLAQDPMGRIWLGTIGQGIDVRDESGWRNYRTEHGLAGNSITIIVPASEGSVWIGTNGAGFSKVMAGDQQPFTFHNFDENNGLRSATIDAIVEDGQGHMWLGTTRGLHRIPLVLGPDEKDRHIVTRYFSQSNGLAGNEVIGGNAFFLDKNNKLWFGLAGGVTCYEPNFERAGRTPPGILLEKVIIDEDQIYLAPFTKVDTQMIQGEQWLPIPESVPYKQNNLRFEVAGSSFTREHDVRYQFRLVGFSGKGEAWSEPSVFPFKEYTNLNPGSYTFMVRARNQDGEWESQPLLLPFKVLAPIWLTPFFLFLYLFALVLVIYLVVRIRVRALDRRRVELEAQVAMRTKELQEEKAKVELRNKELRALDQTVQAINREVELGPLLHAFLQEGMRLFPQAEKGAFLIRDEQVFRYGAVVGWDPEVARHLVLSEEEAVGRYTFGERETDWGVHIIQQFEQIPGQEKFTHLPQPQCMLAMDLIIEGKVMGFLVFDHMSDPNAFKDSDLARLEQLRNHAISALAKAQRAQELKETAERLRQTQQQLVDAAHLAGMSEVASNILHNIGNTLNSVSTSASLLREDLNRSTFSFLQRVISMLNENGENLGQFMQTDPKGQHIPEALKMIGRQLNQIKIHMQQELTQMMDSIDHMQHILRAQQKYTGVDSLVQALQINDLVEEVLQIEDSEILARNIKVEKDWGKIPLVKLQKSKFMHVLWNLIINAREAVSHRGAHGEKPLVQFRTEWNEEAVIFSVTDNGMGIPEKHLMYIFNQGFSTKKEGTGFGLHFCANAMAEMGGHIDVESKGPGFGACFTLTFPKELVVDDHFKPVKRKGIHRPLV